MLSENSIFLINLFVYFSGIEYVITAISYIDSRIECKIITCWLTLMFGLNFISSLVVFNIFLNDTITINVLTRFNVSQGIFSTSVNYE